MDYINLKKEQIEERITALKKKHQAKHIFVIGIPADDEGAEIVYAFLKKPPLSLMGVCMSFAEGDPLKSDKMLLEGTWLEGDERILTDDDMFLSARTVLTEMIKVRKASIEKK